MLKKVVGLFCILTLIGGMVIYFHRPLQYKLVELFFYFQEHRLLTKDQAEINRYLNDVAAITIGVFEAADLMFQRSGVQSVSDYKDVDIAKRRLDVVQPPEVCRKHYRLMRALFKRQAFRLYINAKYGYQYVSSDKYRNLTLDIELLSGLKYKEYYSLRKRIGMGLF